MIRLNGDGSISNNNNNPCPDQQQQQQRQKPLNVWYVWYLSGWLHLFPTSVATHYQIPIIHPDVLASEDGNASTSLSAVCSRGARKSSCLQWAISVARPGPPKQMSHMTMAKPPPPMHVQQIGPPPATLVTIFALVRTIAKKTHTHKLGKTSITLMLFLRSRCDNAFSHRIEI